MATITRQNRILIVDDHALIRAAVSSLLKDQPDMEIVGEADNGTTALQLARDLKPDIVLLDITMPGISGIEVCRRLLAQGKIKVILLTVHDNQLFTTKLMKSGAYGYLTKEIGAQELLVAIREVAAGRQYLAPQLAQQMATGYLKGEMTESPFKKLSSRELEILLMICDDQKPMDIAKRLFLSVKTVNGHRYQIFKKLGVKNDVEMVKLAIRYGLIEI